MRKTLTIPTAGVTESFSLTGISIKIEAASLYETADDVPLIGFDSGANQFPMYPRSTYQNDQGQFDNITLTGTDASAGDEITVISFKECLESDIIIAYAQSFSSVMGTTFTKSASDAAQSLSELDLIDADGNLPKKLYVTVAPLISTPERGIKYAFNEDPVQGEETLGSYLGAGSAEILILEGVDAMLAFRYIADTNTETPLINFTPEY